MTANMSPAAAVRHLRPAFVGAALVLAAVAPAAAQQKVYGSGKPVTIIVATTAGSGFDLNARLLAEGLEKEFPGTRFQISNKPGAGNQVALQAMADAAPDGFTFGAVPLPATAMIALEPSRQAKFTRDSFQPIAAFLYDPGAIAVRADSPFKSLKDLVEAGKQKPGELTIGVSGARSREHLDVVALENATGAKFNPIFHNDSNLGVNSLLGGNLNAMQGSVSDFQSHTRAGTLRLLAVFSAEPSQFAPDVPTAKSQGIDMTSGVLRGFACPKGTPKEFVDQVSAAVKRVADSPESQEKIKKLGIELRYMNADEYGKYWDGETERVKSLFQKIPG